MVKTENLMLDEPALRTRMASCISNSGFGRRASAMSDQLHHSDRGQSGAHVICAAGEDDWHTRSKDYSRGIGSGEILQLFGENIARLQVGYEQDVGFARDGG